MKNHIIFKFIAVLLCAASLLGAVGGVLGVVLLTSGGLYDVTVEEMVSTQVSNDSAELADWLAKNYASTELGGASEYLAQSHFGDHWFTNRYFEGQVGYTITDAEGNELMSCNPELKEQELYACETFESTGKYIHVLTAEPISRREERQRAARETAIGEDVVLAENSIVPADGTMADGVSFIGENGVPIMDMNYDGDSVVMSIYNSLGELIGNFYISNESLGFLHYNLNGHLAFQTTFDYESWVGSIANNTVYEAYFLFPEGQIHLKQEEGPVGELYLKNNGSLAFLSMYMEPMAVPEETVPETTAVTVPENTEATVPPTTEVTVPATEAATQPPETVAETIVTETVPSSASAVPETTVPEQTMPTEINGKPLDEYQILTEDYYDYDLGEPVEAKYVYVPMPELTVEVYMTTSALRYTNGYRALEVIRQYRNYLLPLVGVSLLVFAVFGVYLCTAAGKKPKREEIRAGGLNRLPLDLYLVAGGFAVACLLVVGEEMAEIVWEQDFWAGCGLLVGIGFLSSLLLIGFLFAFVAQVKTPGGFWWRNTLCGHCIRLTVKFLIWLEGFLRNKFFPFLGRFLKKIWMLTMKAMVWLYKTLEKVLHWIGDKFGRFFRWIWKWLHRGLSLLPVTWQWLVAGVVILFCVMLIPGANDFMTVVFVLIPVAIILYGAYCFGLLSESTKRMSKGDLETKVDDQLMIGCFKESANDLNALADVAVVAAQKQLKSERMKTELITNVSHDIKTPLTSIINYVDLLQKPHTEEEGEQYLEVLDRQSQRLKKLIDDLMDMSKANTGNMQVEITTVDAVESVNQALGEFSDKLDRAQLTPVFRHTGDHMTMRADGKLVWRVLSNLLSNAVKYAMPGTRLYIDLMELEGKVIISLKNISREELTVDAEELMERFVRGDDSRNTEGSGLGLNIARSLMDLQKGQMQLLVDGDLFKVTLIFPGD